MKTSLTLHILTNFKVTYISTYMALDFFILVLKQEPEDLTHLAPTAGDVCIPLHPPMEDGSGYLVADVFDEFDLAADAESYLIASAEIRNSLNCSGSSNNNTLLNCHDNNSADQFSFEPLSPSSSKVCISQLRNLVFYVIWNHSTLRILDFRF